MDNTSNPGMVCLCTPECNTRSCSCQTGTSPVPDIPAISSVLTFTNLLDHFVTRLGFNRMGHIVQPGLYRLGNPTPDSPVFVSANYTLSFDALRSSLPGKDGYILVLDTSGVNVWCAAGKGTFGTDELVRSIGCSGLAGIVRHRNLIVPQLGAPGISAHEVLRRSGFRVEYGPIRARDLPDYLKTRKATPEMRMVQFSLKDRLVLIPVELASVTLPAVSVAISLYFLAGFPAALAAISAVIAGTVLFPILLPFLPVHDFSIKGLILGMIVAIPFAGSFATNPALPSWADAMAAGTALLIMPAVTAYLGLSFTGATTFTSRSGVRREIFGYMRVMAAMAIAGVVLGILLGIFRFAKVI